MNDLSKLTKDELIKLVEQKDSQLAKIKGVPKIASTDEEVVEIRKAVSELAKDKKLKAYEVLEVVAKALKVKIEIKPTVRAKSIYRHPKQTKKRWSGNKPIPAWVKDWEAAGKDIEECRIPE